MGGVLYTATRAERDLRERDTSQPNRPSHDLPGPVAAGLATLASALVAGAVPLAPFVVLPMRLAAATSVVLSLGALFVLGGWKGRVTRTSSLREGLRFLAVGGFAALAAGMLGVLLRQPTA